MITPCPACGKGPLNVETPAQGDCGQTAVLVARCGHCGRPCEFTFSFEHALPDRGGEAETINPTGLPSRLIDLGQWVSLFYLLVESGASETSPPEARRLGYRAALCLAEALKFYGDNELPEESAFYSAQSKAVFREHPESFARQRLRDMQQRLPSLPTMSRRVSRDDLPRARRWWQFWRSGAKSP